MACRLRDRISEQYQDVVKILSKISWVFVMCINMTYLTGTVFGSSDYGIVDINPADCVGLYPQLGCVFICKFNPRGASARLPQLHHTKCLKINSFTDNFELEQANDWGPWWHIG
jgi:hypothetical protein